MSKQAELCVYACGHGGRASQGDGHGEGYVSYTMRGVEVFAPARDPGDDSTWLNLPGGKLHWQALRDVCMERTESTVFFVGSCWA